MQSKGNAPTADQKRFRENLRGLYPSVIIHHCVGATGKHNKVEIGHWFIIAVSAEEHYQIHNGGVPNRKSHEKSTFFCEMSRYFDTYHRMPVPDEVLEAIEDYHL